MELTCVIDPAMPALLLGDEARLRQILFNLVGNAIKFTEHGSVRVDLAPLRLDAAAGTARVLLTVSDTGIGIPANLLDSIFEPFSQGEENYTRRFQGAGLGLSIVRKLTGLLGGEMSLESEVGEGTTAYVSLPFKVVVGATSPMVATDATPAAPPGGEHAVPGRDIRSQAQVLLRQIGHQGGERCQALLAEDDEVCLVAGKLMLEKAGCAVTTAINGQEALRRFAEGDFDIVFLDVQMPVMDGVETTRRIRAGEAGRGKRTVPIVAMTAYAMTGDRDRFLGAGMDDYIAKPIDMDELRAVIDRVMADGLDGPGPARQAPA